MGAGAYDEAEVADDILRAAGRSKSSGVSKRSSKGAKRRQDEAIPGNVGGGSWYTNGNGQKVHGNVNCRFDVTWICLNFPWHFSGLPRSERKRAHWEGSVGCIQGRGRIWFREERVGISEEEKEQGEGKISLG